MKRLATVVPVLALAGCADVEDDGIVKRIAPGVASIQALSNVDGHDVILELLVGVEADEDPDVVARETLAEAYPHAIATDRFRFTLTGMVWDDPSVSYQYNDNGEPSGESEAALDGAADEWTGVSTSMFEFVDNGPTNRCPSLVDECRGRQKFDGNNDVAWVNLKGASTLGVTWYSTDGTDEFDMALDGPGFDWYAGDEGGISSSQIDTQTIFLHELGHALGLGHSNGDYGGGGCPPDDPAVMDACYRGGAQRSLDADDIDGVSALYPAQSPCGTNADCDDGDACNGAETCDNGICAAGTPMVCDDGDACNGTETCDAGVCLPGTEPSCDDGDSCTDDSCDAAAGCVNTWDETNAAECVLPCIGDGESCKNDPSGCCDGLGCFVGKGLRGGTCLPL